MRAAAAEFFPVLSGNQKIGIEDAEQFAAAKVRIHKRQCPADIIQIIDVPVHIDIQKRRMKKLFPIPVFRQGNLCKNPSFQMLVTKRQRTEHRVVKNGKLIGVRIQHNPARTAAHTQRPMPAQLVCRPFGTLPFRRIKIFKSRRQRSFLSALGVVIGKIPKTKKPLWRLRPCL